MSTDAPKTSKPPNWKGGGTGDPQWTRWAEMDRAADRHSRKGGHPSRLSMVRSG